MEDSLDNIKFGSSVGYSTEEIERFRKIFRTMPTYEESISSKDLILFHESIGYIKPLETNQKYIEYAHKILGGRFQLPQIVKYLETQHDPRLLMNEFLKNFDRNNDGYVSKEEFEYGMETLRVHDPSLRKISHKNFLKEADANRDGKISISECKYWLNKNVNIFDNIEFGSSVGYSTEEIERFRKIFRTMPTYEESISSKDLILFHKSIEYIKPLETYQKYIEYADKILGGRFQLPQITKYLETQHDSRLLMNEFLKNFDRNNDGYVSKEEFEYGMETLRVHDPSLRKISHRNFLNEADANRDGKISISECKDWLNKNVNVL